MRLHDIISSYLLPRFAEDAEWEQNALDVFVKAVRALSFGLGAPYTRKAISALTDADLQAYFLAYGIVSYYPELSRQTRENMLFELARMYRFLGTPYAITALCRYIFDESDAVEVEVKDNLAFDDDGELIDASLLDLFDIAIDAQSASIGGSAGDRIVANVLKIARNSQALRNIYFRYEDEIQIPVRCADYIGFAYRIGDDYELSRPTGSADETLELLLGMRSSGSGANNWISVTYSAGDAYWAGIINEKYHYEAEKFGLQVHPNRWAGKIGGLVIDYTFGIELLEVYSDIDGNNPVEKGDGWDFEAGNASSIELIYLSITNTIGFPTPVMSYKARFIKHDSMDITVYFNAAHTAISSWGADVYKTLYWEWDPYVFFDNGKKYSIVGLYNGDTSISLAVELHTANVSSGGYYTFLRMKNVSYTSINKATHAVIRIENLEERVAWLASSKANVSFSSGYIALRNSFGETFVENFERTFELVRFEDASGNVVTPGAGSFYFTQSTTDKVFRIVGSGVQTFTAAKVVYRSLPTTKRAWLNTSHTDKNLSSATEYYLYDDDNNKIVNSGLVTLGSGANILAVFNSERVEINKSGLVFVHYTSAGIDYLLLQNNSPSTKSGVACVIYKES